MFIRLTSRPSRDVRYVVDSARRVVPASVLRDTLLSLYYSRTRHSVPSMGTRMEKSLVEICLA